MRKKDKFSSVNPYNGLKKYLLGLCIIILRCFGFVTFFLSQKQSLRVVKQVAQSYTAIISRTRVTIQSY